MSAPLGVQQSDHDNGAQNSTDPGVMRGLSSGGVDHMPQASGGPATGVQRAVSRAERAARAMTAAELKAVTGLDDRDEAIAAFALAAAEEHEVKRRTRSRRNRRISVF